MNTLQFHREAHQLFIKKAIDDLRDFTANQDKRRASFSALVRLGGHERTPAPLEIANSKSLRTKLKMYIYLHNLNKPKAKEYFRKYFECKVEEMELQMETLNDENGKTIIYAFNSVGKSIGGSSRRGGDEFIRQIAKQDKEQYDDLKSYMNKIDRANGWIYN
jgi:hypothetical protein